MPTKYGPYMVLTYLHLLDPEDLPLIYSHLFVDSSPNCLLVHYELILVSSSPILGVGQVLSENRLPQKLIFNHDVFQLASLYVAGQNPSPKSWDLWMFIPKIAINHTLWQIVT